MKILAIANAHALAHVSRLLEIAKVLRPRGHEIMFAGHGKYLSVAGRDGFETRELPYISVEQVVRAVRSQRLWELYPEAQIKAYIDAELRLYDEIQPDRLLLDNRPTARTSADHAGIPTAAVLNVHMSNFRCIPFYSLANLIGREGIPGVSLVDGLENRIETLAYDRLVMGGLNRIRRRLGLKRRHAYDHEAGDLTLLADLPEFNPVVGALPPNTEFIGPLTWHNDLPAPVCLEEIRKDGGPTIYFTLGSEGLDDLLQHLGALTRQGMRIVVATGAADVTSDHSPPDGVFLERYVNTDLLLPHCDAVCCHGGNGTLYQVLAFGLPVVSVATHQEQHYGGQRVHLLGLGHALGLKQVQRQGFGIVLEAIQEVLRNPGYRERARKFRRLVRQWNGPERAAAAIETAHR